MLSSSDKTVLATIVRVISINSICAKPPLRKVEPPEQLQRNLRKLVAQPRQPATALKKSRGCSKTQFNVALRLQSYDYKTNDHIMISLRSSTTKSASLLPAWSDGAAKAPSRGDKSHSLLAAAGKKKCR